MRIGVISQISSAGLTGRVTSDAEHNSFLPETIKPYFSRAKVSSGTQWRRSDREIHDIVSAYTFGAETTKGPFAVRLSPCLLQKRNGFWIAVNVNQFSSLRMTMMSKTISCPDSPASVGPEPLNLHAAPNREWLGLLWTCWCFQSVLA